MNEQQQLAQQLFERYRGNASGLAELAAGQQLQLERASGYMQMMIEGLQQIQLVLRQKLHAIS